MINVSAHIEYLLLFKDCVIIPSFGAVLAHCVPAHYDSSTGEFMPPRREFSFNASLTRSDGLLVASVARRDGLTYEAASRSVAESVETMKRQLAADGMIPLGRIGLVRNGRSGSLAFEPFPAAGIYPSREWSCPLHIKLQSAKEGRKTIGVMTAATYRKRTSSYLMLAASLLLLIGIAVASTFRMKPYADGAVQQASLLPDATAVTDALASSACRPTLVERPGSASAPLLLVLKQHADAAVAVDTTTYVAPVRTQAAHGNVTSLFEDGDYFMVVASLASRADAERFLDEVADKNLRILELDGRFRIYAAAAATSSRLRTLAGDAGVYERYPSAWICRR